MYIMHELTARGRPFWVGKEKRIALDAKGTIEVVLTGSRSDAPQEILTWPGSYLVILTERPMTLEDLETQTELDLVAPVSDGEYTVVTNDLNGDEPEERRSLLDPDADEPAA